MLVFQIEFSLHVRAVIPQNTYLTRSRLRPRQIHTQEEGCTLLVSGRQTIRYLEPQSSDLFFRDDKGIEKADIITGMVTVVPSNTALDVQGGLAVDSTNVYWVDIWAGAISKAAHDGSSHVTLAVNLLQPQNLLLDSGYLFWSDQGGIKRMSINGGSITTIAAVNPTAFTKDEPISIARITMAGRFIKLKSRAVRSLRLSWVTTTRIDCGGLDERLLDQ